MREPAFWWGRAGLASSLLTPLGAAYGAIAGARMTRPGRTAGVPVICIGNPTLGGAGKTPVAIAVARMLATAGSKPFLLSRGYGGSLSGPVTVDPARHTSADVGDEPLLLARAAPTIVASDRAAGAAAAHAAGAGTIVMDDGFQNPGLVKDLSILVIDGRRGLGNAKVFPAGPLRAPLEIQFARASAVLMIGTGDAGEAAVSDATARGLAVFRGRLEPDPAALAAIQRKPVLAFAGIGDPDKFFATLRQAGVDVRAQAPFPDHHRFTEAEAQDLIRRAGQAGLALVTTEKDLVRMAGDARLAALASATAALPVALSLIDEAGFRDRILAATRVA